MNNILSYDEYICENLSVIPVDAGLSDNPEQYIGEPKYSRYYYFGNCKNTVDVDHMWDATQMSNFVSTCKVIDVNKIIDKLYDGDRKLPKELLSNIGKLQKSNKINDMSEIVCALDDYQKIMFIYLTQTDTHYFFDCEM